MPKKLQSTLNSLCHEATSSRSGRKRDEIIEQLWLELVQQGRSTTRARQTLVDPALCKDVTSRPMRETLQAAASAVYAWCESEFAEAAKQFGKLDRKLACQKSQPIPKECCTLFRVHLLTWSAAAETRTGNVRRGRQLLGRSQKLLKSYPETEVPNCWGWYHAELARLAFWNDELESAHREYAWAQQLFARANNRFGQGEIAGALARLHTHQGNYRAALGEIARASRWLMDPLDRAKAAFHTGRISRYQRDFQVALESLESGLIFAEQIKNRRWEAHLHDVLGDIYLEMGDLEAAEAHFGSAVCCRSQDPMIRTQSVYQQAKLSLAKALQLPRDRERERVLESVLKACDELQSADGRRMLGDKALLVAGKAHLALQDYGEAARSLARAARGFRRHGARWYAAEAALSLGEVRFAQGRTAEAARVWSAGVREAVDKTQRDHLIQMMRVQLQNLEPETICSTLEALVEQNNSLAELRYSDRRSDLLLRTILQKATRIFEEPGGGLVHIRKGLDMYSSSPADKALREALNEIRGGYSQIEALLACQRELLNSWSLGSGEPEWISFVDALEEAGLKLKKKDHEALRKRPELGLFTDPTIVTDILRVGHCFFESWGGRSRVTYRHAEQDCAMVFELHTTRAAVNGSTAADLVAPCFPSVNCLHECQVQPREWARLAWACLRLRSIGGRVVLRAGETNCTSRAKRREYCMEIHLPCDEIPFWKL